VSRAGDPLGHPPDRIRHNKADGRVMPMPCFGPQLPNNEAQPLLLPVAADAAQAVLEKLHLLAGNVHSLSDVPGADQRLLQLRRGDLQ
jgi:hypothetical protein